ncbi:PepSY-associated TM helix domain-containing protein [Paraburkholderia rhizosphaerae]|uniref:Putative iron-regulated membrane protein n=1 Tax=Paraburkholderia rhizosphaerae TaxID=480658 RepID=A0A4R8LZM0_9BURK|nr:PepSY domain-containing protein [Paraburkholderia rhizosphaerae]TDY54128.1 putative iron-regulated membrane protein [Paraburkholderia rhizosphaerae]
MSTAATDPRPAIAAMHPASRGYRTLWRWHFYAGLFVMPFLVVLAITGTLYCFQPQIEPLLYPHRFVVEPRATPRLAEATLLANARRALPVGSVALTARVSVRADRSAEFIFRLPDGDRQSVYVNPYDGAVLGTLSVDNRFMQVDRMIHRKLLLGKPGELLMELVACWTLVMIGTGVALWWPRAGATLRAALVPRFSLRGRPLWKSVHAALGIWLAAGALAFVISGLPWTGSWGKQFKSVATSVGLGSPRSSSGGLPLRSTLPGAKAPQRADGFSDVVPVQPMHEAHRPRESGMDAMPGMTMDDLPLRQVPWAVGATRVPESRDAGPNTLTLDQIVSQVSALGLSDGYDIALPVSPSGVYTVSYFPADPKLERTLSIDQYSGAVLKDIRYSDYGAVSKAVSYGTSLHMGRYFGVANQLVCAALSFGLATLAVTGCVMWWKRRPGGTLGAPSRERAAVPMRGWKIGLVILGVVFPMMGVTLVAVCLADLMLFGRPSR